VFLRHMRVRFGGACCSKEGRTQLTGVVEVALPVQRGLHQGKECNDGSKAQATTIRTELDAERRLLGKKFTGCRANRQRKNCRIERDTEGKIDQRIPRRIGFEFSQRELVPQDCAHVEARAAEHLRASLLGCRDRPVRRATG